METGAGTSVAPIALPNTTDEEKAALKEAEADVDAGLESIEADLEELEDIVAGNLVTQ